MTGFIFGASCVMLQASATLSALDVLSCGYIMYRKPSLLLDILTVTDIQ